MPARDFFSFCTSLKPLELKALGELSYIRHVDEGVVLYATGQPGDTFYIINRGTVELVGQGIANRPATLHRGDFVGDLEALAGSGRTCSARAAEPLSVRCFHPEDFAELMRRVPSFFRFLSEHLACRLQGAAGQPGPIPAAEPRALELAGSLANFDLVTIYQTIVNSAQTGELRIYDDRSELLAAFGFEEGQPRNGQFEHLTGEEALLQLFLHESLSGTFAFNSRDARLTDCVQSEKITRHAGEMLITAIQGRDELHELKEKLHYGAATLLRRKLNFEWPKTARGTLEAPAIHLWQLVYSAPLRIDSLYARCNVCELKIYQVIEALAQSGQLAVRAVDSEIIRDKVA